MKKTKIINGCIILILVLSLLVIGIMYHNSYSDYKFQQEQIDKIFMSNFSLLCDNLNILPDNEAEQIFLNKENLRYAHTCFSLFSATSYSENSKMNQIFLALYNLSEKEELYLQIDSETIEQLNKLKFNMSDNVLINNLYDKIVKQ